MELNEDCIRDIIQYLVENLTVTVHANNYFIYEGVNAGSLITKINTPTPKYSNSTILYSLKILDEVGYIRTGGVEQPNIIAKSVAQLIIYDVTYRGQKFYYDTLPEDTWQKTKSIIARTGNRTLEFIGSIVHDSAVESCKTATEVFAKAACGQQ